MEVRLEGLAAEDADRPEAQVLKGMVITSDMEEPERVEKVINAEAQGRKLEITWSHSADKIPHYFTVNGIERGDAVTRVRLSWDGAPRKVSDRGHRKVEVPPPGLFELVDVEAVQAETRFVRVRFSLTRTSRVSSSRRTGRLPSRLRATSSTFTPTATSRAKFQSRSRPASRTT